MENLQPAQVSAEDLPEGFVTGPDPSQQQDSQKAQRAEQAKEQRQLILEQACTQEALARLGRIRMVRESKALSVENAIISMAMQNKLPGRITEAKLIEMLERGNAKNSGGEAQISIQRKRYAFDSDEEDDDDEELL